MPRFGSKSNREIGTLHPDLQVVLRELIKIYDVSVTEGIRTAIRQNELFTSTPPRTTLDGYIKKSKHQGKPCKASYAGRDEDGNIYRDEEGNPICSFAVDIVPYKKGVNPWDESELNLRRFYFMMGIVRAIAERLLLEGKITHKIRFGLDWDSDNLYTDQNFHDLPHMELVV